MGSSLSHPKEKPISSKNKSSSSVTLVRGTERDRAILDLKVQRDKLRLYVHRMDSVLRRELEAARELVVAGKKDRALLVLRKKKYQQSLLDKTELHLLAVEEAIATIEFQSVQNTIFENLRAGTDVLRLLQREVSLEQVEKLVEDTQDAYEYQKQVTELLSSQNTFVDNDQVQQEFDSLLISLLPEPATDALVEPKEKEKILA